MDCCWVPCLTAFLVGCFATTKRSTFSDSWSTKITWMVYQWHFVGQWWSMVYQFPGLKYTFPVSGHHWRSTMARLGNHGNPPFLGRNNGGVTCPVRWQSTASILSKGSMQRGPLRPSKSMLSLRKSRIGDSPGDLRSFLDHLGSSQSASGYSYSTIMYNST